MPQGTTLHFVTFPDGRVDGDSVNIFSQHNAKVGIISSWLSEHFFGQGCTNGVVVDVLWRAMAEKGFKVHSIDVPRKDL